MPVNYEIKSQLAKLLATEDIVVENKNVETAQFNVETRVLTLPMWKRASESVYDMLVGHEVGHALYTPNEWNFKTPLQFVNVTEDARIEKLMKRRYPGLSKSFYSGYKELSDNDFFSLEGEDIGKMNLADRANLWFKIGNFVNVPIDDGEEKDIINMIADAETFQQSLKAAERLYKFCKSKANEDEPPISEEEQSQTSQSSDSELESDNEESDNEAKSSTSEHQSDFNDEEIEPEVLTDQAFEEGAQQFNSNTDVHESGYYEIPELYMENVIATNSMIHDELDEWWNVYPDSQVFGRSNLEYKKFKSSAQKEVNYLVKEFECKKSADSYARTTVSRSGVLDCSKLHTYKYNEDIFKKINLVPDGKNHGLIFILDWSGSMVDCMLDTMKQLFNLIWFCNKVNIPFDVYAFTNSYTSEKFYDSSGLLKENQEKIEGKFYVEEDVKLMNILTSKVNKKILEKQMMSIWRIVFTFRNYVDYEYPVKFGLSGTPLNETLIALHQIIPQFKKENKIQKVQCVILTDGEANTAPVLKTRYNHFYKRDEIKPFFINPYCSYLRNRKTGFTYKFENEYYKFSEVMLKDLSQSFPETNFIGIRLISSREIGNFIKRYESVDEKKMKEIRKKKFHSIKNSGYASYFAMISNSLNVDAEFDIDDGASKAKIKSAFVKNLKAKSLNKKVLTEFVDLIC